MASISSLRPVCPVFTPSHRGGSGSPLVCLHGFSDTWRTWELVLPELERHHDVLAPTLPGHAGGTPLSGELSDGLLADAVEHAMDDAGFHTAHIVGNSLGGYVALELAARGRAESIVALAPAGGWATGDDSFRKTFRFQLMMHDYVQAQDNAPPRPPRPPPRADNDQAQPESAPVPPPQLSPHPPPRRNARGLRPLGPPRTAHAPR